MNGGGVTCEEVIEQLFFYLDQELDDELRKQIDHHLSLCRDCFSRAEFERRLRERVQEAAESPAPERLHRRIHGILDRF